MGSPDKTPERRPTSVGGVHVPPELTDALARGRLTPAEVAGLGPEELDAIYELGAECLDANRADEAVQVFLGLTTLYPYEARFWRAQGIALHRLGVIDAACAAYDAALCLEPGRDDTRVLRAETRLCLGDGTGARADLAGLAATARLDVQRRRDQLLAVLRSPQDALAAAVAESPVSVHDEPRPAPEATFVGADGQTLPLTPSPWAEAASLSADEVTQTAQIYAPGLSTIIVPEPLDTLERTDTALVAGRQAHKTEVPPAPERLARRATDTGVLPRARSAAIASAAARDQETTSVMRGETTAIVRRRRGLSLLEPPQRSGDTEKVR